MLSIIIPVYNVKKHLRDCLESVICLELNTRYEIILVDDGSFDGSSDICDKYLAKYPSFIQVIHKENGGLASARNVGLENAKGEYITFMDSDDIVEKDYIKCILEELKIENDLYVFSYIIDYIETNTSAICELKNCRSISSREAVRKLEDIGALNVVWNKVYRASFFRGENQIKFVLNSEPGEDLIFNSMCFSIAKSVTLLNKCFYHWIRRGEDTLANRFRDDLFERNKVFIDYRNKLYENLDMEKTDYGLLAKGNVGYIFACIPNMYRKNHTFSKEKRIDFYKQIIYSDTIKSWIKNMNTNDMLLNQFSLLYRIKSPLFMDFFYHTIMGIRNVSNSLWVNIRKWVVH